MAKKKATKKTSSKKAEAKPAEVPYVPMDTAANFKQITDIGLGSVFSLATKEATVVNTNTKSDKVPTHK